MSCPYRGYLVLSAPPPSAGGIILCEMLNVLSGWDLEAAGVGLPQSLHLMAEAMRHAYVDRNTALGDPEFVADPRARLLSPGPRRRDPRRDRPGEGDPVERARPRHPAARTGRDHALFGRRRRRQRGRGHLYAERNFGSGVVAPGTGFLLNNEMDDFTVKPGAANLFGLVQGTANAIAPGKRPLSSMSPTIVEKDGRPVLVLGSPGGPRIITAVLETLTNIIDFGMAPQDAVAAPRFHHQFLPDTLFYERGGFAPATLAALAERGYHLAEQSPWGAVELIAIGPNGGPGGHLLGVNDPRRPAGIGDRILRAETKMRDRPPGNAPDFLDPDRPDAVRLEVREAAALGEKAPLRNRVSGGGSPHHHRPADRGTRGGLASRRHTPAEEPR